MKASKIYTKETGKLLNNKHYLNSVCIKSVDCEYFKWLEDIVEKQYLEKQKDEL